LSAVITAALALTGCGSSTIDDGSSSPHVDVVTPEVLVVGQPLTLFGRNFLPTEEGYTRLVFDGVYYTDAGRKPHRASFVIAPRQLVHYPDGVAVDGRELPRDTFALRWNRFGPFQMPFNMDVKEPGVFQGVIKAANVHNDGSVDEDPFPSYFNIQVAPSIVINRLSPIVATDGKDEIVPCGSPALRVFGGIPYYLEVAAIGVTPVRFDYTISQGDEELGSFTHAAGGLVDSLGLAEGEEIVFTPLADDVQSATAVIAVVVTDASGGTYRTVLPIPVIRAMQLLSDGERKLAEYYEPVVVHGPIVGAIGTGVSYSESHSESRQSGVSVTLSRDFSKSHGITSSSNWSEGISVSDTTSTSTSDTVGFSESENSSETYGTSYSHSDSTGVSYGTTNGSSWKAGLNVGNLFSIPGLGISMGNDKGSSKTEGWNSTTSDTTGTSFSGTYGVGTQHSISTSTSESQAHTNSTTYNIGGSEGISENYTMGESESWGETWSTTSSDSTLLSYSSRVPRDRCAVVYRQTVRFVRQATLVAHDMCGVRERVAELVFNEWSWSPNIAIAEDCSGENIPPSTQPAAQCFLACE
jgi:hypothetical protein